MRRRAREPLSEAEVESLNRLANGNALALQRQAKREALERYGVTTPMAVIPTGLAMEAFTRPHEESDFRSRYGLPAQARLLLYVGRAAHEKNIGFLIEMRPRVLVEHPDTRLIVTGEGPAQDELACRAYASGWHEDAKAAELLALYRRHLGRAAAL